MERRRENGGKKVEKERREMELNASSPLHLQSTTSTSTQPPQPSLFHLTTTTTPSSTLQHQSYITTQPPTTTPVTTPSSPFQHQSFITTQPPPPVNTTTLTTHPILSSPPSDTTTTTTRAERKKNKKKVIDVVLQLNDLNLRRPKLLPDISDLSSLSSMGDYNPSDLRDLISSRSTQESSFLEGIYGRHTRTITPMDTDSGGSRHSSRHSRPGTGLIMESTRVPNSAKVRDSSRSTFARLDPATPSIEELRSMVDLLP